MGFRFRRSIRLLPGIRVNFGKTGSSVSIGGHGATVNVSSRGTRTTVGLPGTGLSYSTFARRKGRSDVGASDALPNPEMRPEGGSEGGFFVSLFHLVGALLRLVFVCVVLLVQWGVIAALVIGIAWAVWHAVGR